MSRSANLPVPAGPVREHLRAGAKAKGAQAAGPVEAQLWGQPGARRGLKGGAPVLDAARAAYLSAEWSGPADRRPSPGLLRRERV
jgi:hypothetical protein